MYRLGIKWFCRQGKTEVKKVIHLVQKKTKQNKKLENRKASNWKKFQKFHVLVTVAILMPTSPDINVLTRGALVLETKDSFVSPVTNLN